MTAEPNHQRVLIVDFGSQVTQLIARRVRESGVYCEIHPYDKVEAILDDFAPAAVILSGGPASTTEDESPRATPRLFDLGVPVLGVCYGEQLICAQLGGKVEGGHHREFGRAEIVITKDSPLFAGIGAVDHRETVWMSHGDRVVAIPGGFEVIATSTGAPFAAIADETRKIYGVQFHPEVAHTPRGAQLLKNFTHGVAGLTGDWTMAAFRQEMVQRIRDQVGQGKVICGLSGGVDSSVAAVLIHEAIGDQLTCVFVDTGLLRQAGHILHRCPFLRHSQLQAALPKAQRIMQRYHRAVFAAVLVNAVQPGDAKVQAAAAHTRHNVPGALKQNIQRGDGREAGLILARVGLDHAQTAALQKIEACGFEAALAGQAQADVGALHNCS